MKTKMLFFRFTSLTLTLTMLLAPFTAIVGAAPPNDTNNPPILDILPAWAQLSSGLESPVESHAMALPPVPEREPQLAPLLLPGGSTISGTLTANDIWGPGVITVTGDIMISPTVTIVITPNTTIQMATTDGLSGGLDTARIEWIISGTLESNGPVTFTSQSATPAGADWFGLRFLNGGQGTLVSTTIQYGILGVELDSNGPMQIEDSTIRYMTNDQVLGGPTAGIWSGMNGPASTVLISNTQVYSIAGQGGLSESGGGGPDSGGAAYGITLWGGATSFTPTLWANAVYSITGGRGGDLDLGAVVGGSGGDGGSASGIEITMIISSPAVVCGNQVHHVASGDGGDVTVIGASAQFQRGGNSNRARGMYVSGGDGPADVVSNTVEAVTGGDGGDGGWDANAQAGSGALATGIELLLLRDADVRANTVASVTAGDGGNGQDGPGGINLMGDPGGPPAAGGSAYGIVDWGRSAPLTYTVNQVFAIRGGRGGTGGNGGSVHPALGHPGAGANGGNGGDAYGLYVATNPTATVIISQVIEGVYGGPAGNGGHSGKTESGRAAPGGPGGTGGDAWGILTEWTAQVHDGFVVTIHGGSGGQGGNGSDVADEVGPATGGSGGNGGLGGRATGVEVQGDDSLVDPTTVADVKGGDGGNGGAGGTDDETVMAGAPTGDVQGGPGGFGGLGGDAHGYYNNGGAQTTFYEVSAAVVSGGDGGLGGNGGWAIGAPSGNPMGLAGGGFGGNGGQGGAAYGLQSAGASAITPTVQLLTAEQITGGNGGGGGVGGFAMDEAYVQTPPGPPPPPAPPPPAAFGMGGTGGPGGQAFGLYNSPAGVSARITQNEIFLIGGGRGGAGGRGGDGMENVPVANWVLGGNGGPSGQGGDAWGVNNLAVAGTLVARTTVYSITAGSAATGGNGGDIIHQMLFPPGSFPPGNGGSAGNGGVAYGVDSSARTENNLAYRIYGGAGGNGGMGGWDIPFGGPTINLGGAGGNGNDGIALATTNDIYVLHNTGAKTQGGAAGGNGGPPPPVIPQSGQGVGADVVAGIASPLLVNGFANNILFRHDVGINASAPVTPFNNLISATTTSQGSVNWGPGNITGSLATDPFVDLPNDDYHLTGCSSVAAEAGSVVNVYEDGADGDPRPWGFFDIGYDEYIPTWFTPTVISGVIAVNTTWPAGHYLLTGDVLIAPGVALTVEAGALVQVNPLDLWNLGIDLNRIEIINRGTLRTGAAGSTPVTFTVAGCNPAPGQWYGIQFLPGSDGYLDPTIIEYGVHGVVITTTNSITIADTIIRYNRHTPPVGNAWGAGMAIFAGTHLITNTDIYSNVVIAVGGAWAEGGGVYITSPAGPSLFENCTMYDNQAQNYSPLGDAAGGGVNILFADPILRHCEIYNNRVFASGRAFGGGVLLDNSSAVIEADTFIHDNAATAVNSDAYGGGVSIGQAMTAVPPKPIIRDSRVTTNTLNTLGPAWSFGGGIGFYMDSWTVAIISDTLIADNVNLGADACGGGIGMAWSATADHFDGNLVRDNLAQAIGGGKGGGGGGICLLENNVVSVTNNLVIDNWADDAFGSWAGGGGIYADGPNSFLINNTVVSNTVGVVGGAYGDGGGVYLWWNGGVLLNTIVVNNTAGNDGGGVYWAGWAAGFGIADYNDVWNNACWGFPGCGMEYDSGVGVLPPSDISIDPLFVGAGGPVTGLHLQHGSPCVDAGISVAPPFPIPSQDYDDQPRPQGASHDIGFDEVQGLEIEKRVNAATSTPGGLLIYTIVVTNPSAIAPANGGWITDVLPISTTWHSGPDCNLSACGYSAGTVWWNGNVPASTVLTLAYTVTVDNGLADGTDITNTAFFAVGAATGWSNVVTSTIYECIPLTAITITGSTSGGPGTYTFTTSYGPTSATLPITYLWDNDDTTADSVRSLGIGTHTLTVTATNCSGLPVTDTHVITIACIPITGVDYDWAPSAPEAGEVVTFSIVSLSPTTATTPITYEWSFGDTYTATGDPVTHTYAVSDVYSTYVGAYNPCSGPIWMNHPVTVTGEPDIDVTPLTLSATLDPDDTVTDPLTVTNAATATANLNWSLAENPSVSWLSATPSTGIVAPGGDDVVSVAFDAAGMTPGVYTTTLEIASNDPDESLVRVPVTLTVNCVEVSSVTLSITSTGTIYTDTVVYFSADLVPDNAAKPYNYYVSVDGVPSVVFTDTADPFVFTNTFATTGTHSVEFGAWNCSMILPVTNVITFTVREQGVCVELDAITIAGDTSGYPGVYTFTTDYEPFDASIPITYTWDDGGDEETSIRSLDVGTYTLMVTATNLCTLPPVTDTHQIVITAAPVCTEVTGITLAYAPIGTIIYTDTVVHFSADIAPDDADMPYTYTIDYGSGPTLPNLSSADPYLFTYTFPITGTHTVTFSAWNCAMIVPVSDSVSVTVSAYGGQNFIYLPIVMRNF